VGLIGSTCTAPPSRRARSSSRSRTSNSDDLRSVASAPHRPTRSRSRRPSGVSVASRGSMHSLVPSWQMTAFSQGLTLVPISAQLEPLYPPYDPF